MFSQHDRIISLWKEGYSVEQIYMTIFSEEWRGLKADCTAQIRAYLRRKKLMPPSDLPEDKKPWRTQRRKALGELAQSTYEREKDL